MLIDAFLVRSLLVPALISLVGPASGWPGTQLSRPAAGTPGKTPADRQENAD